MLEEYNVSFASNIYSYDIHHRISILQIIADYDEGVDIAMIQNRLPLNRRTIYKYIDEINDIAINEKNEPGEELGYIDKNNHIYRYIGNRLTYQRLHIKITEHSIQLLLCKQLLQNPIVNIKQFCFDNYISETALRRNITKFNKEMEPYQLSIAIYKGNMSLSGEPEKIRFGIATFLWRIYRGVTWPFETVSQPLMQTIAKVIFKEYSIPNDDGKLNELMFILATNFARSQANMLPVNPVSDELMDILIFDEHDQRVMIQLTQNYGLPKNDTKFVLLWLKTIPDYYLYRGRALAIDRKLASLNSPFHATAHHFVDRVQEKLGLKIDFSNESGQNFLVSLIAGRVHVALFPDIDFTVSNLHLVEVLEQNAPHLLSNIKELLDPTDIAQMSPDTLHALCIRYAYAFAAIQSIFYFEPTIKVLVQLDAPSYIDAGFRNRLETLLQPFFNVEVQLHDLKHEADLVVHTDLFVNSNYPSEKQIYVHSQITTSDFNHLMGRLNQIKEQQNTSLIE